jgi:TupA-like ATPgrasp
VRIPPFLRQLKRSLVKRSEILRRYDARWGILRNYRTVHGKDLNIEAPKTFTEKLFCRMLSVSQHGDPTLTRLADKFLAREYVRAKVGNDHLVDLLWTGFDPAKIPFDNLPEKCVIKANHGSRMNIFLQGKYDRRNVIETMRRWLNTNYYYEDREYHYYDIKPRILIESHLDDGQKDGPLDYRFWCFNGRPEVIHVNNHRRGINPFYDLGWQKLSLRYALDRPDVDIPKPENFESMLAIASKLSFGLDFVRLDLYNVHGRIYFGEFTFFPVAGRLRFVPDHWDLKLGRKWILDSR